MADTIQLNPGIANAERYEGVLDLADADTRVILEGSTDKKVLIEILEKLGFSSSEAAGLAKIKIDYDVYKDSPDVRQRQKTPVTTNKPIRPNFLPLAGLVFGLPALIPEQMTAEKLEKNAKKYAEAKVKVAGNKVTQVGNVYSSTYTNAQQEYYNTFARNNRKTAERIFAKSPNNYLMRAISHNDALEANKFSTNPVSRAINSVNRLPSGINKIASTLRSSTNGLSNALNAGSKIAKLARFILPISTILMVFIIVVAIVFVFGEDEGGGGGAGTGGSEGTPGAGAGPVPVNPVGGTCVTPLKPDNDWAAVKQYVHIEYKPNYSCALDSSTCNAIKDTSKSSGYRDPVGEQLTSDQADFIYSTFAGPLGSTTYRNLLTNNGKDPIHLYFFEPLAYDSVTGGGAYGSGIMAYWGFFELLKINGNKDMAAHLLIHESTHIIQDRNGLLGFELDKLSKLDGTACYDNEWLKSYAYRTSGSGRGESCAYPLGTTDADRNAYRPKEAEAEATANNVFYKPGATNDYNDTKCSVAINYQQACGNTYAWIKQNIFGGDDFFNCTPAGTTSHTFVALGDSLTAWPCDTETFGCIDSNKPPWKSYGFTGKPWPTYLTTDDPNLKLLFNAGYPAQTTAFMLAQEPGVLSTYKPDVLFVLGGTNDLINGGINEQGTIANLKSIISTAKSGANAVKNVIVLTIPNQCNKADGSLNTAIKGLSTLAPVIDISNTSSLGLTCADFQSDQLHLTDGGAKKVADYIDGQIKSTGLLPAPVQMPSKVFYCQGDTKWGGQAYDHGTIASTGCSVTSMAMILSSYGGKKYTPGDVATMFHNNGWDWPGSTSLGTNNWLISSDWLGGLTPKFQKASAIVDAYATGSFAGDLSLSAAQLKQIRTLTDAGWLMLAAVDGKNLPTPVDGGHTIVIETADTTKGTVTIRDPYDSHCALTSGQDITINANSIGWWLITPIKIK